MAESTGKRSWSMLVKQVDIQVSKHGASPAVQAPAPQTGLEVRYSPRTSYGPRSLRGCAHGRFVRPPLPSHPRTVMRGSPK